MKKLTLLFFALLIAIACVSKCNAQQQDSIVTINLTADQEKYFADIEKQKAALSEKEFTAMVFIVTSKDSTYQLLKYPIHKPKKLIISIPKKKK